MPTAATKAISLAVLALASSVAQAQTTQSTSYRVYLFHPNPEGTKASIEALEAAIGSRGRVSKDIGLLPTKLADKPGEPAYKTVSFGPATFRNLVCEDAYAQVKLASDTGAQLLGSTGERFFGCAYPSKAGTRLTLVIERYIRGNTIGGSLVGFIRNSIEGDDVEWGKKITGEMIAAVQRRIPDVLIEMVDLAGGERTRPDGTQVDALISAAAAGTAPAPSAPQVAAAPAGLMPAVMPVPTPSALSSASAPSMAAVLEARKQLNAIGLTYHSVEAFHDAIRRKDLIAVELFITASAVSSKATAADGSNAIELSSRSGDSALFDLVQRNPR
jgi:hypothetical protein